MSSFHREFCSSLICLTQCCLRARTDVRSYIVRVWSPFRREQAAHRDVSSAILSLELMRCFRGWAVLVVLIFRLPYHSHSIIFRVCVFGCSDVMLSIHVRSTCVDDPSLLPRYEKYFVGFLSFVNDVIDLLWCRLCNGVKRKVKTCTINSYAASNLKCWFHF